MSSTHKFIIVLLTILLLGGIYIVFTTRGDTTLGLTLSTNANLEDGLVGHWTFDGADVDWSSSTAEILDASGSGNTANAAGSISPTSGVAGAIGQAIYFDGSGDYIDLGDKDIWEPSSDNSLSVAFWYKGLRGSTETFLSHSPQSLTNYWHIRDSRTMFCGAVGCSTSVLYDYTLPDDNEWHHVAVVLDEAPNPDELSVYVDGELDATVTSTRNGSSAGWGSNTRIGSGNWAGTGDRQGPMDDVRIYNRALSSEDVARLYELGGTTHIAQTVTSNPNLEDGLTGHWTFDGEDVDWSSTTAEVLDKSGGGYHGDAEGGMNAALSPVSGKIGQGMHFDSTDDQIDTIVPYTTFISNTDGTIAAWIKPEDSTPPSAATAQLWNASHAVSSFNVFNSFGISQANNTDFGGDKIWAFNYRASGIDGVGVDYVVGEWTHVAWVHTGGVLYLYKNGALATSTPSGSTVGSGAAIAIGSGWIGAGAQRYWEGAIDDVRTYNRALSADEISRLYGLGATTHIAQTITSNPTLEDGLTGHWTFDGPDMQGATSTDVSGNGYDGVLENGAKPGAGRIGQGVYGDGVGNSATGDRVFFSNNLGNFISASVGTVALWIKPEGVSGTTGTFYYDLPVYFGDGGGWMGIHRGSVAAGPDRLWVYNYVLGEDVIGIPYNIGEWIHVTWVHTGGILYAYKNGEFVGSTPSADTGSTVGKLRFLNGYNAPAEGYIDDVRTYNRALSAAEIKRLYGLGN